MSLERLCARDVMTSKVVEAQPHESLRAAVRRMTEHRIHCLLVRPSTPDQGLAILTGKDCIQVIVDAGEPALDELCVEDAMTKPAVTVPAALCIPDCLRLMRMAGVRSAPVVEGSELAGILSFTDVLAAAVRPATEG